VVKLQSHIPIEQRALRNDVKLHPYPYVACTHMVNL
jgi:hypothetical protein